jgi:hypothetical protein
MALNLSSYHSIQTNLFIKIDVPGYQVLTFSDYHKSFELFGSNYTGIGQLLGVTKTSSNLRATPEELTITISGIPVGSVGSIMNHRIKGSTVKVYRGFFDPVTAQLLNISGNPTGKFQGVINNYTISDELDMGSDTGSVTLILTATSAVELLNNKISGRRTNPTDQSLFYPGDKSMDRVPGLTKSNFNFGATK